MTAQISYTPYSPFFTYSPNVNGIITPTMNEPSPLGFSMVMENGFASYLAKFT